MPQINVLPKHIAELIAAGEVVERPASVVKETVENSIDAKASHITVEIQRGGISYIRVTDDGCGISQNDVPKAFLRHATSKIKNAYDLDAIATLGFRGEALAAASSVAKIELFTKTGEEQFGTHYKIEGGNEVLNEETGCPDGTTIVIRDLFYNTPARMKFLKKDVSEGTAVSSVVERQALAHPEIAFKLIRDGKQVMNTSGDGKLESAVYSVLGREFSKTLIPVESENDGIRVAGYICKPVYCRQSRSYQFTFLNGRFVISGTVQAAVEQAFKNSAMVGKFPAFVLTVDVPFETVDVNVHPAKTQIRFSDEKRVFTAVYAAVKNALLSGDTRPQIIPSKPKNNAFLHMSAEQYRQTAVKLPDITAQKNQPEKTADYARKAQQPVHLREDNTPFFLREDVIKAKEVLIEKSQDKTEATVKTQNTEEKPIAPSITDESASVTCEKEYSPQEEIRLIGEAFSTYIIVERAKSIFLIDKHAAHERIIFNGLKRSQSSETQALLAPVTVKLIGDEYSAAVSGLELLAQAGFEAEDFGNGALLVRAVPSVVSNEDVVTIVTAAASSLAKRGSVELDILDNIYHTVACKAAIKAGNITSRAELLDLAYRTLNDSQVMYCPHGRPVAFEIKQSELEKHFGRIQ